MIPVLAQLIVAVVTFLEFSDASVVDEDAAVSQMENIAYVLGQLSQRHKDELVSELSKVAARTPDAVHREFIADLPGTFGLI